MGDPLNATHLRHIIATVPVSGGAIRAKGTLAKRGPPGWLAGEWMTMGDDDERAAYGAHFREW